MAAVLYQQIRWLPGLARRRNIMAFTRTSATKNEAGTSFRPVITVYADRSFIASHAFRRRFDQEGCGIEPLLYEQASVQGRLPDRRAKMITAFAVMKA